MSDKGQPAVITLGGKQHLVYQGAKLIVNRIDDEVDSKLNLKDLLNNNPVTLRVVEHNLGDKINGLKFKSKSNYLRHYGHRQHQTILEVISVGEKKEKTETVKPESKKAEPKKTIKKVAKKAVKEDK